MEVSYEDADLDDLEVNAKARTKLPPAVVKAFRRRIWQIRAFHDERDFYSNNGLNFEKYQSVPGHYSVRLNDQYRLILRFEEHTERKTVVIVAIGDYH